MKNETKYIEMIDIISHLHQYVPIVDTVTSDLAVNNTDKPQNEKLHPLLFGGDQLTAARVRGCQELRINSDTTTGRLQGLIPVAEDWHTAVTLLVVSIAYSHIHVINMIVLLALYIVLSCIHAHVGNMEATV